MVRWLGGWGLVPFSRGQALGVSQIQSVCYAADRSLRQRLQEPHGGSRSHADKLKIL
ncbi:hypothetical protein C4K23_2452 [Pseudomonas chlororaphis]|nr:hypothetical protein C4K23_2452 [Pseudomonas chlororaphis]